MSHRILPRRRGDPDRAVFNRQRALHLPGVLVISESSTQASSTLPPQVARLAESILEENPMHRRFLENALAHTTPDERHRLNTYLEYCRDKGLEPDYITRCYLTIVEDTLREQIHFRTTGRYRHATFADVADSVYFNDEYMNRYMYGLAITAFLWPNHLRMGRMFEETLPTNRTGRYLEVGPGHGYYLMTAIARGSFDTFLGIDLSQSSIDQTRSIVEFFNPELGDRFSLQCTDFLDAGDLEAGAYDALVMGEVLEHVEEPDRFLRRLADLAAPGAYIYVTTCINAPAIDHIHLWRNTDDLEALIERCGLTIRNALRLPYEGKTIKEAVEENLAINVAYVLEAE